MDTRTDVGGADADRYPGKQSKRQVGFGYKHVCEYVRAPCNCF